MVKRWFIREDTDIKEFAKALKACKDFTPIEQKRLFKFIMGSNLEKRVMPGIKRRRVRKKRIKKEIDNIKIDLYYIMLDMLEEKWKDIPEGISRQDGMDVLKTLIEIADKES